MPSIQQLAQQWQAARDAAQTAGTQASADEADRLRQQLHDHPSTAAARARTDRADQGRRTRGGEVHGFR
jgi:hypothetical protein